MLKTGQPMQCTGYKDDKAVQQSRSDLLSVLTGYTADTFGIVCTLPYQNYQQSMAKL
jgi:hypothetical protein